MPYRLGEKYAEEENYEAAIDYMKRSVELDKAKFNSLDLYFDYERLSDYYSRIQQGDSCLLYVKKSLLTGKAIPGLDYKSVLTNLSHYLKNVGYYNAAIQLRKEIISITKDRYGSDSPRLEPEYQMTAWLCKDAGYNDMAVDYAKKVVQLAYAAKNSKEDYPFKRAYNESFESTIYIIQKCDDPIRGINYILNLLELHKDAINEENIDNALNIVWVLSRENDFTDGCLAVYKYRTLCGSYEDRLTNLINLTVEDKNLKYDIHAEEYAASLYDLVMSGEYSKWFSEEEIEQLLYTLQDYYTIIGNIRKSYDISKVEYEWRLDNNKDILLSDIRVIIRGAALDSEAKHIIDFSKYVLSTHRYDKDSEITDLIKFKLFESYCNLGDKEGAYRIFEDLGEREDYESLRELASVLFNLGDTKLLLPIAKKVYGFDSIPEENKEVDLLILLISARAEKDIETLQKYGKDYVKFYREKFSRDMLSLANKEKEKYIRKSSLSYGLATDFFIGINDDGELWSLPQEAYDYVLLKKGMLLKSEALHREVIRNSNDSVLINSLDNFNKLDYRATNHNYSIRPETLKRELVNYSSESSDLLKTINYTWQDVRDALEVDEVAIEFIVCHQFFSTDNNGNGGAYLALIIRNDYKEPAVVPLSVFFNLSDFSPNEHLGLSNDIIFKLIWAPLYPYIHDAKTIYFSPTSFLNHLPIEYVSEGGVRVCDAWNLIRVSSTREIIDRGFSDRKHHAILFGGLKYDVNREEMIEESRKYSLKRDHITRSKDYDDDLRDKIKYLPCSLTEVNDIAALFSDKPTIITGKYGTEESFKALDGTTADILHIATHSYFTPDLNASMNVEEDEFSRGEKAMSSSGLLFSGAKNTLDGEILPDNIEDGIVTAKELSNLNLSNVDLAIVSACSSGMGDVASEGIFGLQRGFKLAGVKSLIMSLWKIDDAATSMFMTEFYKHYLKGETKRESLQAAQSALRRSEEFSQPMYWAGFILLDGFN